MENTHAVKSTSADQQTKPIQPLFTDKFTAGSKAEKKQLTNNTAKKAIASMN